MFRYAIATGQAKNDPTGALKGALLAPIVRHRAAIVERKALGQLLRAIRDYPGGPEVCAGLQLLALTLVPAGRVARRDVVGN